MNPMDAFEIMGIEPALDLSGDTVRARFQEMSRVLHPDAGGDAAGFQRLVEARDILGSTPRRLRHWAELQGWREDGPVGGLDEETGDVFMRVARVVADASAAVKAREKVQAEGGLALARALAECRVLEMQTLVVELGGEVARMEKRADDELLELARRERAGRGRGAATESPGALVAGVVALASRFAYLAKWRQELREALARLA